VAYDGTDFVLLNSRSRVLPGRWTVNGNLAINQSAYFDAVNVVTATGANQTINFSEGNKQYVKLSPIVGSSTNLVFTGTAGPSDYRLLIQQDATGSRLVTWPANCLFIGGGAPVLTILPNGIDIASIYYDGTNYYVALSYDWRVL